MEAVVEFQAFSDNNNRFLLKELAIVGLGYQTQLVFAPPFDKSLLNSKARRTARWLTRNYHKIAWEEGRIPFRESLLRNLLKPFAVVHTKGLEKAQFLRKFHPDVREFSVSTADEEDRATVCLLVKHNTDPFCECALRNAIIVYRSLCGNNL